MFDPEPRLRPNLAAIEGVDMPRFKPLATAMLGAYRGLNWMESSAAALADFSGLSGETTVTEAHSGGARFDLTRWLLLNPEKTKSDRQNLVGASYIPLYEVTDAKPDGVSRIEVKVVRLGIAEEEF